MMRTNQILKKKKAKQNKQQNKLQTIIKRRIKRGKIKIRRSKLIIKDQVQIKKNFMNLNKY